MSQERNAMADPALEHPQAHGLPFSAVIGLLAGALIFTTSLNTLRDIDLYWHLLAGQELAAGAAPNRLGLDWSFAPSPKPWTSTQWLAEVLFYALHSHLGWAALAGFRVITAALSVGILSWTVLRGRTKALAGFPFLVAATAVAIASQERPQQFTFIGAAVLGGVLLGGLMGQDLPRWWVLVPTTAIWANLHGGWVLAPATLGMIALGGWLDRGPRDRTAWHASALAGMALLAGCLTPSGFSGVTAVVRFSAAADLIKEWQPTQPAYSAGLLTVALLACFVVGWSRPVHVPLSEVVAGTLVMVFSWLAWRNIAPGMALAAPLAAERLVRSFPNVGRPEASWSAPLGVGVATLMTVAALAGLPARDHLPVTDRPIALATALGQLPPGQRVLNDYNTAGLVLYFGGEGTHVAIDGRSDRYGSGYVSDYVKLMSLKGDWMQLLKALQPTSALVKSDEALAFYLSEVAGWTKKGEENGYVLLVRPNGGTAGIDGTGTDGG